MAPGEHDHRDVMDMLARDGKIRLQLHAWDEDDHPNLTNRAAAPVGHGVLFWFQVGDDEFDESVANARELQAEILDEPHATEYGSREFWVKDPDDYVVVFSTYVEPPH
jgi:hypothetical protein